jgi:hypothetical protein
MARRDKRRYKQLTGFGYRVRNRVVRSQESTLAISFSEASNKLLSGQNLAWQKFAEHKNGSITLKTAAQRRLLSFLLTQPSDKLTQGSESIIPGLLEHWTAEADPASQVAPATIGSLSESWRLHRVEAFGFGGLTIFGGPIFDLQVNGSNWCLEGQNGSGKTSLSSAILWALTGKRIREHDGPVDESGERTTVSDTTGKKVGDWPACAAYPSNPIDLAKPAEVWVRLTFHNAADESAIAYRRFVSSPGFAPQFEIIIDPRLLAAREMLDIGLLMPARVSRISFGERSQTLYEAVKMITGLDRLADVADACVHFTHGGRKFLKYAKDQGIDGIVGRFNDSISKAQEKAKELTFPFPAQRSLGDDGLIDALTDASMDASSEAGKHLASLKSDVDPGVDPVTLDGRTKIRAAVGTARAITAQTTRGIPVFEAWASLKDASEDPNFASISSHLASTESDLLVALHWNKRQMNDVRFRLKALAAQSFIAPAVPSADADCPLCFSHLSSSEQRDLASELAELQRDAKEAERKIEDVCRAMEDGLIDKLPPGLRKHRELLGSGDPKNLYAEAVLQRFCEDTPFCDVLIGLAARLRVQVTRQQDELPVFSYERFVEPLDEPIAAVHLRRTTHEIGRLVALTAWWKTHRSLFRDALSNVLGIKQPDGSYPPDSIGAELDSLDKSLAKAQPLDELAILLIAAAKEGEKWLPINEEQKTRECISKAIEPLKEMKHLVGAQTAQSISSLSARMKGVLDRIHLIERLTYTETSMGKKSVHISGSLEPGMQIDASLIANTSWLRAMLWAFIIALRETTVEALGFNPFPLLILDDPQTTFDPRNKRKWAQELARMGNLPRDASHSAQVFLTTHERLFFQCVTHHERLSGEQALMAGVNKTCGTVTIINGAGLARAYQNAIDSQDDALARKYIADVRVYCEDLLKFMLRAESPKIPDLSLDGLRKELKRLIDGHVAPYDRKTFADLINILSSSNSKDMKVINESHHKGDESIGIAQANDVKQYWELKALPVLHEAFAIYDTFESFKGEPRTFTWAKNVLMFPSGHNAQVKALSIYQTGIAAAAKTDGRAGDGVVTVQEWEAAQQIVLHNHDAYQLTAGTLDPVAMIGDIVIVSNYAPINPRNLVVATFGSTLLARRYNLVDAHPDIAILTGQSIDPYAISEPVIVLPETKLKKIVGTLFAASTLPMPISTGGHEVRALSDPDILQQVCNGAKLLEVKGRSAEPIALEGQFLMTRNPLASPAEIKTMDGRPVVAIDENGTRYFKRLRCMGSLAVLESLNPDGTTGSEVLSFVESAEFPRITHVLQVIGILFELPKQ